MEGGSSGGRGAGTDGGTGSGLLDIVFGDLASGPTTLQSGENDTVLLG